MLISDCKYVRRILPYKGQNVHLLGCGSSSMVASGAITSGTVWVVSAASYLPEFALRWVKSLQYFTGISIGAASEVFF